MQYYLTAQFRGPLLESLTDVIHTVVRKSVGVPGQMIYHLYREQTSGHFNTQLLFIFQTVLEHKTENVACVNLIAHFTFFFVLICYTAN